MSNLDTDLIIKVAFFIFVAVAIIFVLTKLVPNLLDIGVGENALFDLF